MRKLALGHRKYKLTSNSIFSTLKYFNLVIKNIVYISHCIVNKIHKLSQWIVRLWIDQLLAEPYFGAPLTKA